MTRRPTKDYIVREIQRTAQANGGVALGRQRFAAETGIRAGDWRGRYWARWGDAVREAGLSPNPKSERLENSVVLENMALLVREFGRFPTEAEQKMRRRADPAFPSHNTFRRFGPRSALAAAVASWCAERGDYDDVAAVCATQASEGDGVGLQPEAPRADEVFGSVYLLRSGRFYKVGRSNAVGRRERELAIQLPEKAVVVHSIRTDDPAGVESYWHRRFGERRKNGEWFELTAQDVAAFRRRRFM